MNTRICRGYLGVFGAHIDRIAQEYTQALIEQYGYQNSQLKQGEYHITVIARHELQALRSKGALPLNEHNSIPRLDQLNSDLEKANTSPIVYGLGTNRKGVYWVTVSWATGQRFRTQLGLPPKQFHITLTPKDEHDIDKGPSSVIWVHPSLVLVKAILGHDSVDLVSSPKTEFLASFAYGLLAQYELALAQSAAEFLILCEPTNSRSFVCLGDVSIHRGRWKLAMLCFGSALKLHLEDPASTDLKTDRISTYCLKQLRRSAEYTEWGSVFMVTELSNDDITSDEFSELPASPTLRSYLCQPWPVSLRQHLQYIYRKSEPVQLPKRALESRARVFTLIPDKAINSVVPTDDAKYSRSPRVNEIIDLVASLNIREHANSSVPGLGLLPLTSTQGHAYTCVRYTMPRFFSWIIPFYMALMSTPRNADDITALASPAIGIRHILTLTEETPLPDAWFRQFSTPHIRHTHVPIPNYKPPTLEQMDIILRRIHEPGGSPVLVHCGGGKGRAGTVAACYLAAFGFEPIPNNLQHDATPAMSANEAVAAIRLIRPSSIETSHQEEFVKTWVSALWKRNKLLVPRTPEPHATPLLTDGSVNPDADLIVLCGLPGSGKSWFSQAIARRGGFLGKEGGSRSLTRSWRIVSQDESGSRATCETDISRPGQPGSRVILDRCNPTSEERRLWIKLASWSQHPIVVWFDYQPQLCIDRAQDRESHPTLLPGPRVRTAVASMKRSFQPPSDWKSEGFQGFAHVTSFEASIELCKLICPVGLLKFPRTTHILDLGAATSDDIVAKPLPPDTTPIRTDEIVVITEKIDGANLGFSLSPFRELRVQNRSHYVNSQDHIQFRGLDSWISSHREGLYAVLDRDNAFPERYILYGEWMAATHSIPYTKLGDMFYAFDLFDRATNTFASRRMLEASLIGTGIQLTPVICTDKAIPSSDTLAKLVRQDSQFYLGPVEGIYVKVETESVVRQRGKVVREDFIAGNEHWSKGAVKWNAVLESS